MNDIEHPEPKRVLQLFSWEAQAPWQHTSARARLEWLDFIIHAAWAGAAHRQEADRNREPNPGSDPRS
jgi:hypothetical protein